MLARWTTVLCLAATTACTAISDFRIHQCNTNADCDPLSGPPLRCEQAQCTPGCADNAHCASIDPRFPICEFRGGGCVALESGDGECYVNTGYDAVAAGGSTAEDLVTVGAFAATARSSVWLTLQLAVDELNAGGGVPGATGTRPLVGVLCEDSGLAVAPGLEHVIGGLGARGLVASLEESALSVALPSTRGRALLLSPFGYDTERARGDSERFAWHLGSGYAETVAGYAPLVRRAVAAFESSGGLAAELKLAIVVSPALEDRDLWAAIARTLVVGGDGVESLTRLGRAREFMIVSASPEEVGEIATYRPNLVLVFASGLFTLAPHAPRSVLIERLEEATVADPAWQPLYVFGPRNASDPTLDDLIASSESLRARSVGVRADAPVDAAALAALTARFHQAFPLATAQPGHPGAAPGVYDALYLLAYSIAAAPRSAVASPADVARGLRLVTQSNAEVVDVGPDAVGRALELIRQGVPFNLRGVAGIGEFDAITRARSGALRAYCWTSAGAAGFAAYDPGAADFVTPAPSCAQAFFAPGSN